VNAAMIRGVLAAAVEWRLERLGASDDDRELCTGLSLGPSATSVVRYHEWAVSKLKKPKLNMSITKPDQMDDEMVALLPGKTEAERLSIAWGMWRAARRMIERIVAAEPPDLTPQEQEQVVANRMSHGT
jgi:hypothetical protein